MKYIAITTSANFGNMLSMAAATPLLPFLPLLPAQILLNNFISDLPSFALSTDAVDPEQIARPQRWDVRAVRRFMIVFGLTSSAFDLLTFAILIFVFDATETTFHSVWFVVSLLTELGVVLVLRTRRAAFKSPPSRRLIWTTAATAAATLTLPFLGSISAVFGFVPLSWAEVVASLGIVAAYVFTTEFTKRRLLGPHRDG